LKLFYSFQKDKTSQYSLNNITFVINTLAHEQTIKKQQNDGESTTLCIYFIIIVVIHCTIDT